MPSPNLPTEDTKHEDYELGVSCHYCIDLYGNEDRARFRERQRQIQLAEQNGMHHIGPQAGEEAAAKIAARKKATEERRKANEAAKAAKEAKAKANASTDADANANAKAIPNPRGGTNGSGGSGSGVALPNASATKAADGRPEESSR